VFISRVGSKAHVSARAIQLAVIINVKVNNVNGSAAVVLDDLVRSMVGSTPDDPRLFAGSVILDGQGILTNVFPPYELKMRSVRYNNLRTVRTYLQRAVTLAMNTLSLVLADDHIAERGTRVKKEDCIRRA